MRAAHSLVEGRTLSKRDHFHNTVMVCHAGLLDAFLRFVLVDVASMCFCGDVESSAGGYGWLFLGMLLSADGQ